MTQIQMVINGSCKGDGNGKWGALMRFADMYDLELSGRCAETTGNRMKLTALLEGLRVLKHPCQVLVMSSSRCLFDPFEKGWLYTWHRKNRRTNSGKPVEHRDLWEAILAAAATHEVTFTRLG